MKIACIVQKVINFAFGEIVSIVGISIYKVQLIQFNTKKNVQNYDK